jgi:hypothetical protein
MRRSIVSLAVLFALVLAPLAAHAKKYKNSHLAVPPSRMVNLRVQIDAMDNGALTLDGLGGILILQQFALVVTDVIVTPVVVTPDNTTPIWVSLTLGGRGFEIREVGAHTHTVSLGGGIAATPNQPLGAANFSSVPVQINVLGYLVDGQSLAIGISPEP